MALRKHAVDYVKKYAFLKPQNSYLLISGLSRCFSTKQQNDTFRYSDLQIKQASRSEQMPKPDFKNLKFGEVFSDHMFEVEWTASSGWGTPRILPLHNFQCHPGSKIFHYAQTLFEGMKAFHQLDGSVALFRPEKNMERMLRTAERAAFPSFDQCELLKCLKKLVSIDKEWVPSIPNSSLYIRPTMIATQNSLGVHPSNSVLIFIITCPVGPYFPSGVVNPISLLADPRFVRAWPGGVGDKKMGSNYAPTLYVQRIAEEQGLQQVLWLFGEEHRVSEVGAMNAFFFLKKESGDLELVTPPLDGTILPGVVRQSVLDLAREWDEFSVSERIITMKEVVKAQQDNRLLEMFVCGTAASVCPVKLIRYQGTDLNIPTMTRENPVYHRLFKSITDIQYGRVKSAWSVPVD